jgi:hypothetical protein
LSKKTREKKSQKTKKNKVVASNLSKIKGGEDCTNSCNPFEEAFGKLKATVWTGTPAVLTFDRTND